MLFILYSSLLNIIKIYHAITIQNVKQQPTIVSKSVNFHWGNKLYLPTRVTNIVLAHVRGTFGQKGRV